MNSIALKDFVSYVRDELESLDRERQEAGRDALFQLEKIDLELTCVVSELTAGKAGFDLKVVSLGKELRESGASTHTIRLQYGIADSLEASLPVGARAHSTSAPRSDRGIAPLES